MMICGLGLENSLYIDSDSVSTLQIENPSLYSRICQSLLSDQGEQALEGYSVWDDANQETTMAKSFLSIVNPFNLPWADKSIVGGISNNLESMMQEDEDLRYDLTALNNELIAKISNLVFQLNAEYSFMAEWNLPDYLKLFRFNIDIDQQSTLFDNLIRFIEYMVDSKVRKALFFINLKCFLTKNELEELFKTLIFYKIKTLLLENKFDNTVYAQEKKLIVDQHFIEYTVNSKSESPSSSQGGFCSNGFGAVTF